MDVEDRRGKARAGAGAAGKEVARRGEIDAETAADRLGRTREAKGGGRGAVRRERERERRFRRDRERERGDLARATASASAATSPELALVRVATNACESLAAVLDQRLVSLPEEDRAAFAAAVSRSLALVVKCR